MKRQFRFWDGVWFGNVDEDGNYGIVTTESEVRFAITRYFNLVKGTVRNAGFLVSEAKGKNLLAEGDIKQQRLALPELIVKEEKNEKKNS